MQTSAVAEGEACDCPKGEVAESTFDDVRAPGVSWLMEERGGYGAAEGPHEGTVAVDGESLAFLDKRVWYQGLGNAVPEYRRTYVASLLHRRG